MPNINPVDLQTLGARVTDPAQLTEGRWYAVRVNCTGTHNPLVHAKYIGVVFSSVHEFEVCDDDYEALNRSLGLARRIGRDSSSIRTGKLNTRGVCEIFKFKQVVDEPVSIPQESPYDDSNYATCARYGIKVGDTFKVINADRHGGVAVGDIVTLQEDDGSSCPCFTHKATGNTVSICLYRLVPVAANQSNTPTPFVTLSPIDQFKSEIDALLAQAQQKRDQITELSEDIAGIAQAVEDTRAKLRASLEGYI